MEEDLNISEAKAKNFVIENVPEDASEEVMKINDMELVKPILREVGVDENFVASVKCHPTKVSGINEYRSMRVFTRCKENRDIFERTIAKYN